MVLNGLKLILFLLENDVNNWFAIPTFLYEMIFI